MPAAKYTWKSDGKKHSIPESKHKANVKGGGNKGGGGTVSPADYIRLGPAAAQLKSTMDPKKWRQAVLAAHKMGWTVASALDSGTPASLKQRTDASLVAAAKRTTDTAFTPQVAELDYADKQNSGLRQKRISDQASYDQWASQKAAEVAGKINDAQSKYMGTIQQSTDARIADATARQNTLQTQVQQGAVGDMSNSIAVKGQAERAAAEGTRARLDQQQAAAQTPVAASRAAAVELGAIGAAGARRSEIEGDYNKTRDSIFKGRLKMNSDRAAAQVSEYSSLLKTEMDKASSNRDFAGLQASLDVKQQIANQQNKQFGIAQAGLNARNTADNATTQRGQNLSAAQRAADRRARADQGSLNRSLKASEGAANRATKGAATKVDQAKLIAPIERIAAILKNSQTGKHGKKGTGYLYNPGTKHWEPARKVLTTYYQATDAQINAGLAHAMGKKLTPQQRQALGLS